MQKRAPLLSHCQHVPHFTYLRGRNLTLLSFPSFKHKLTLTRIQEDLCYYIYCYLLAAYYIYDASLPQYSLVPSNSKSEQILYNINSSIYIITNPQALIDHQLFNGRRRENNNIVQRGTEEEVGEMGVRDKGAREEEQDLVGELWGTRNGCSSLWRGGVAPQRTRRHPQFPRTRWDSATPSKLQCRGCARGRSTSSIALQDTTDAVVIVIVGWWRCGSRGAGEGGALAVSNSGHQWVTLGFTKDVDANDRGTHVLWLWSSSSWSRSLCDAVFFFFLWWCFWSVQWVGRNSVWLIVGLLNENHAVIN